MLSFLKYARFFTSSKTSVALEPHSDADDGREVDEAEAETGADADGDDEREDIVGEGRQHHAHRSQQCARYRHRAAAPPVHERT